MRRSSASSASAVRARARARRRSVGAQALELEVGLDALRGARARPSLMPSSTSRAEVEHLVDLVEVERVVQNDLVRRVLGEDGAPEADLGLELRGARERLRGRSRRRRRPRELALARIVARKESSPGAWTSPPLSASLTRRRRAGMVPKRFETESNVRPRPRALACGARRLAGAVCDAPPPPPRGPRHRPRERPAEPRPALRDRRERRAARPICCTSALTRADASARRAPGARRQRGRLRDPDDARLPSAARLPLRRRRPGHRRRTWRPPTRRCSTPRSPRRSARHSPCCRASRPRIPRTVVMRLREPFAPFLDATGLGILPAALARRAGGGAPSAPDRSGWSGPIAASGSSSSPNPGYPGGPAAPRPARDPHRSRRGRPRARAPPRRRPASSRTRPSPRCVAWLAADPASPSASSRGRASQYLALQPPRPPPAPTAACGRRSRSPLDRDGPGRASSSAARHGRRPGSSRPSTGRTPRPRPPRHDPARARRLLDRAGYPIRTGPGPRARFRLVYKTSSQPGRRRLAEAIQAQLAEVGIAPRRPHVRVGDALRRHPPRELRALRARLGGRRRSRPLLPGLPFDHESARRLQPRRLREPGDGSADRRAAGATVDPAARAPIYARVQRLRGARPAGRAALVGGPRRRAHPAARRLRAEPRRRPARPRRRPGSSECGAPPPPAGPARPDAPRRGRRSSSRSCTSSRATRSRSCSASRPRPRTWRRSAASSGSIGRWRAVRALPRARGARRPRRVDRLSRAGDAA